MVKLLIINLGDIIFDVSRKEWEWIYMYVTREVEKYIKACDWSYMSERKKWITLPLSYP